MNSFLSYLFRSLSYPSLEATCLFYHLFFLLSTPFSLFYLFYILFHLFSFFLGRLSNGEDFRHISTCFTQIHYEVSKKINPQNRSSVGHWRRHPDLNWGSRCCRPMPYHLAIAPYWSGLRGSNSLPPPWQGGALPDELNPHCQ